MAYANPIPLRGFEPDNDPRVPGVLVDTDGWLPSQKGLKTFPSFVPLGTPVPGPPTLGAFMAELVSGFRILVAGTQEHLYRFTGSGWEEFDGAQMFDTQRRWVFAVYGNHILAVNGSDPDQVSVNGAPFRPLSDITTTGSPPIARYVEVNDQSVFLALPDSNELWFSSTDQLWALDNATLTGRVFFTGTPGPITSVRQIRGGVVVYKRESFYMGQFMAGLSPFIYDFGPSAISKNVGVRNHEAVVNVGDVHMFLGNDDFYLFDGSSLQRIPNQLREWFLGPASAGTGRANGRYLDQVIGRWDREASLAVWHYSSVDAEPAGARDEWLAYNVRTQKWTKGTTAALGVDQAKDVVEPNFLIITGMTYEQFGDLFQTYDNADLPDYNDPSLAIEIREVPGLLDSVGQLYVATGPSRSAFLMTGEISPDSYSYYQLGQVRPVFSQVPIDRYAHLQVFKRRVNGWPIPDLAPFPEIGLGVQAVLTRDGAFNIISTARAHTLKIDVTSECEICALAYDLTFVGTD